VSVGRAALRRAQEKTGGAGLWGDAAEGPAQVILGVGMAAGKARAAVTQHTCDDGEGRASLEEFAGYAFVGDAPVGGRIAVQDAQTVQAGLIQTSQRGGINVGMGNQAARSETLR
jgi:hypothetical protein